MAQKLHRLYGNLSTAPPSNEVPLTNENFEGTTAAESNAQQRLESSIVKTTCRQLQHPRSTISKVALHLCIRNPRRAKKEPAL